LLNCRRRAFGDLAGEATLLAQRGVEAVGDRRECWLELHVVAPDAVANTAPRSPSAREWSPSADTGL